MIVTIDICQAAGLGQLPSSRGVLDSDICSNRPGRSSLLGHLCSTYCSPQQTAVTPPSLDRVHCHATFLESIFQWNSKIPSSTFSSGYISLKRRITSNWIPCQPAAVPLEVWPIITLWSPSSSIPAPALSSDQQRFDCVLDDTEHTRPVALYSARDDCCLSTCWGKPLATHTHGDATLSQGNKQEGRCLPSVS